MDILNKEKKLIIQKFFLSNLFHSKTKSHFFKGGLMRN